MSPNFKSILRYAVPGAFILSAVASPVFAQNASQLNNLGIGLFPGGIDQAIIQLIRLFLLVGGVIAFLFVLYGGFVYLTAGGDSGRAGTGRTIIINALIGIIVIFLSYALVSFVVGRTRNNNIGGNVFSSNFSSTLIS